MFQQFKLYLKFLPTPIAGLALGIVSLGSVWEQHYQFDGYVEMTGVIIASMILFMLLLRIIFHPQTLIDDFSHHVLGSLIPTFAMTSMVIASALSRVNLAFATGIWLMAILLHSISFFVFVYYHLRDAKWEQMVPSWFIPLVGLVVAVFTCPDPVRFEVLCLTIFVIGLCNYMLLLPIMLNRLILSASLPDYARPTIAILAAPASLCLTSYLSIIAQPSPLIVAFLFGISVLMTLFIYIALLYLLRLAFTPSFASYTFPLVISAKAILICAAWSQDVGMSKEYVGQLELLGMTELVVATLVVLWVSICYIMYLWRIPLLQNDAKYRG